MNKKFLFFVILAIFVTSGVTSVYAGDALPTKDNVSYPAEKSTAVDETLVVVEAERETLQVTVVDNQATKWGSNPPSCKAVEEEGGLILVEESLGWTCPVCNPDEIVQWTCPSGGNVCLIDQNGVERCLLVPSGCSLECESYKAAE